MGRIEINSNRWMTGVQHVHTDITNSKPEYLLKLEAEQEPIDPRIADNI